MCVAMDNGYTIQKYSVLVFTSLSSSTLRSPAIQRNDILVDNLTKIDWQSAARCTVWT